MNPGSGTSTTIQVSLRTTVWQGTSRRAMITQSRGDVIRPDERARKHHDNSRLDYRDGCWLVFGKSGEAAHKRTRSSIGGLSQICQGAVDGLLGLVPVLPQQHKADLLFQLRGNEAIGDLPIHNIVCNAKSVAPLSFQHSERFKAVLEPLSFIRCTASGGAHPRSVAGSSPPGPAECSLSADRSWAQTSCGGSAWRREACSIVLLPPPLSPRTSPTYKLKKVKQVLFKWKLPLKR